MQRWNVQCAGKTELVMNNKRLTRSTVLRTPFWDPKTIHREWMQNNFPIQNLAAKTVTLAIMTTSDMQVMLLTILWRAANMNRILFSLSCVQVVGSYLQPSMHWVLMSWLSITSTINIVFASKPLTLTSQRPTAGTF
jgi:hypothetical protein